ncbi:hypothetical protein SFRURICE_001046 [Spodoptera frugiperda]|nr:hypothetical protein SFRURICE_001046 [Spodoptera frugiperda]
MCRGCVYKHTSLHKHPDWKQLFVQHTKNCSVRELNLLHVARQPVAQTPHQPNQISSCVIGAFTNIQVHTHMNPDPKQSEISQKELIRGGFEAATCCAAAGCPATAPTVHTIVFFELKIRLIKMEIRNDQA